MNRTIGFIFARGGSKGLVGKNILPLNGKPLIAYAIETGLASQLIDRVIVSTDDQTIADIARQYGAEVPFIRPKNLSLDDSPEWLAWQHAIKSLRQSEGPECFNTFVSIPPTSPLRVTGDIDRCIEILRDEEVDIVITIKPSERNPYFNMVVRDSDGLFRLVNPVDETISHRQSAPTVYDMTTVAYAASPNYVLNAKSIFDGRVSAHIVPAERALDIDSKYDFEFAEYLIKHQG